jgi:hypothetical protein
MNDMGWREWAKLAAMGLCIAITTYQAEVLKLISDGVITPTAQFRMNLAMLAGLNAGMYAIMAALDQTVSNALAKVKSVLAPQPKSSS